MPRALGGYLEPFVSIQFSVLHGQLSTHVCTARKVELAAHFLVWRLYRITTVIKVVSLLTGALVGIRSVDVLSTNDVRALLVSAVRVAQVIPGQARRHSSAVNFGDSVLNPTLKRHCVFVVVVFQEPSSDGVDDGLTAIRGPESQLRWAVAFHVSGHCGQQGFRCETTKILSNGRREGVVRLGPQGLSWSDTAFTLIR